MKKIFILALFTFSLIKCSSAVLAQESQQQEVQREQILRQQMQQGADETAARQKEMEKESQQNLLQEQQKAQFQALHPFGITTPAQKKKNDQDELNATLCSWSLLLLALAGLVYVILHFVPNRLINTDRGAGLKYAGSSQKGHGSVKF